MAAAAVAAELTAVFVTAGAAVVAVAGAAVVVEVAAAGAAVAAAAVGRWRPLPQFCRRRRLRRCAFWRCGLETLTL